MAEKNSSRSIGQPDIDRIDRDIWHLRELRDRTKKESRLFEKWALRFVEVAGPFWVIGDGAGGWVFQRLAEIAHDNGLPVEESSYGTIKPMIQRLADRDGWTCKYCLRPLGWGHESVTAPVIDHVVPKSRGGSDKPENLVLACWDCNTAKGARTPEQWRAKA